LFSVIFVRFATGGENEREREGENEREREGDNEREREGDNECEREGDNECEREGEKLLCQKGHCDCLSTCFVQKLDANFYGRHLCLWSAYDGGIFVERKRLRLAL